MKSRRAVLRSRARSFVLGGERCVEEREEPEREEERGRDTSSGSRVSGLGSRTRKTRIFAVFAPFRHAGPDPASPLLRKSEKSEIPYRNTTG